jgi:hypothetical protein
MLVLFEWTVWRRVSRMGRLARSSTAALERTGSADRIKMLDKQIRRAISEWVCKPNSPQRKMTVSIASDFSVLSRCPMDAAPIGGADHARSQSDHARQETVNTSKEYLTGKC